MREVRVPSHPPQKKKKNRSIDPEELVLWGGSRLCFNERKCAEIPRAFHLESISLSDADIASCVQTQHTNDIIQEKSLTVSQST